MALKTLNLRKDWSSALKSIAFAPDNDVAVLKDLIRSELDLPTESELAFYDEKGRRVVLSANLDDGLLLRVTQIEKKPPIKEKSTAHAILPPGPQPWPIVGNIPQLFKGKSVFDAIAKLQNEFGDVMALKMPAGKYVYISDPDIWAEVVSQPDLFEKIVGKGIPEPLSILRTKTVVGEGLFTTSTTEEIWAVAHRLLMPAFGLRNLKTYVPAIYEQVERFVAQLERMSRPDKGVNITVWTTKLTFDTIGICAINKQFETLAKAEPVQFIKDIAWILKFILSPAQFLPVINKFVQRKEIKRRNKRLYDYVQTIINERRDIMARNETVPNDLLQTMLTAKDRVTGKKLPDTNIVNQIATFLVAGHETTSGLISYAIYHACKNPKLAQRLAEEVDNVLGRDYSRPILWQDINKLEYTEGFLKETLRVTPNILGVYKVALTDTTLGNGKYLINKGDICTVYNMAMHLSTKGFGLDAKEFKPERWRKENADKIHPYAYNPFGAGIRACIGYQFALLEAKIALATIYQRFSPRLVDPDYVIVNDETITLKPKDLFVHFEVREEQKGVGPTVVQEEEIKPAATKQTGNGAAILFLFGSNMGTSEEFAKLLAKQARQRGLSATVSALDDYVPNLPTDGTPVVIITSTYNGTPPDNAVQFSQWLESANAASLKGTRFAVCGTGNKQWTNTFQEYPKFIADRMKALGAEEIYARGVCDADGDIEADFEKWSEGLWQQLMRLLKKIAKAPEEKRYATGFNSDYEIDFIDFQQPTSAEQSHGHDATMPQSLTLHREARDWLVTKNMNIQSPSSDRITMHLELALPPNSEYCTGDHFGVLPKNSQEHVEHLSTRCGLDPDKVIMIYYVGKDKAEFPTEVPISIRELLSEHVDLQGPLYRDMIRQLAELATDEKDKAKLEVLAGKKWQDEIIANETCIVDLLDEFASINISIEALLTVLPPIKPRYYSISSSPTKYTKSCTITVGLVDYYTKSGKRFKGISSNFLRSMGPNSYIKAFVKDTGSSFRMPEDKGTNMLLIGAGTGVAPMIGFIQERATQKQTGESIVKTLLYFGCRRSDWDYLYRQELEGYLKDGVLSQLEVGYSAEPGQPKQYVQDRLMANAEDIWKLINDEKTNIYVCGNANTVAVGVREAVVSMAKEQGKMRAKDAESYVDNLIESGRYLQDVWAVSI